MRLEELNVHVNRVEFGQKTHLFNGLMVINRDELVGLLQSDRRFSSVKIELARPGENCRIVRVADIIEPRIKINSNAQVFPGIVGPLESVGSGRTICLKGIAIVETWQMPSEVAMIIDMNGPVAGFSLFGSTQNVVLIAQPQPGVSRYEYATALKQASLSTALYLAKAAMEMQPDEIRSYDLNLENIMPAQDLPRIAYVCQLFSHKELIEPLVYGSSVRKILPTVMHPNEFFDGAIVNFQYESLINSETTYSFQNHPVIKELYIRHGIELIFAGVLLKDSPSILNDKERSAVMSANLAKWNLKLDGIIITKEGGGHPQVDLSLMSEKCEGIGIRTVIMLTEFLSTTGLSDETVIFNASSADAVISCGMSENITIPLQERILGDDLVDSDRNREKASFLNPGIERALEGGIVSNRIIRGALSQFGEVNLTTVEY